MANVILTYVYVSDTGNRYRIGVNSEVALQLSGATSKIGATLWDGAEALDGMPGNMRPRQVQVINPAGKVRYVPCLVVDCPLYNPSHADASNTVSLEDSDGASTVYTKQGTLSEHQRKRRKLA
jgi:hypothetical protein